ncbi:MAG: hypothetical protein AAF184_12780 [Pseudomonadota bacterium]
MPEAQGEAYLQGGNIYLSAEVYSRYLAGLSAVALLERDGELVLLPVRQEGAGGSMIKVVNKRGDRVIPAREYLASCGIPEDARVLKRCRWDDELAALRLLEARQAPA